MKRILNCVASDFGRKNTPKEIKKSIIDSEGRTILVAISSEEGPLYPSVTNGEMAAAFGADLLLLKKVDVQKINIAGLGRVEHLKELRNLTGTAVGLDLIISDTWPLYQRVSKESITEVINKGPDFISLTTSVSPGSTPERIALDIRNVREAYDGFIMLNYSVTHGVNIKKNHIQLFINNGVDMIVLPAPGTVPGVTEEQLIEIGKILREQGVLLDCVIETSQEGADQFTIQQIALSAKRSGCDVLQLGEKGCSGMPTPESILQASIALKGKRHTYVRMARSAKR